MVRAFREKGRIENVAIEIENQTLSLLGGLDQRGRRPGRIMCQSGPWKHRLIVLLDVLDRQHQVPASHIDDSWQPACRVHQVVAVAGLGLAIGQVVDVQMCIELKHERFFTVGPKFVIERQNAQVVAASPYESL